MSKLSDRTERQLFLTSAICVLLCAVATDAAAQSEFVRKGDYAIAGNVGVFSVEGAGRTIISSSFGVSFAGTLDFGLFYAKDNLSKETSSAVYAALHIHRKKRRRSIFGSALFGSLEANESNWALGVRAYAKDNITRHFYILPVLDVGYARVSKSSFSIQKTTEPFVQLSLSFVMGRAGKTLIMITPSIVLVAESPALAGVSIGALLPFGTDRRP